MANVTNPLETVAITDAIKLEKYVTSVFCDCKNPNEISADFLPYSELSTLFLKDLENPEHTKNFENLEILAVQMYFADIKASVGNSSMDEEWSCQGKGYYVHDHIFNDIKSVKEKRTYIENVLQDIQDWRIKGGANESILSQVENLFLDYQKVD